MRITNTETFIQKSKEIYHDKFDYSLTNYVKSSEKVKIICPVHGVFEQTPNKHLAGRGCPGCNKHQHLLEKRERFIADAKSVHGDRYDYSKVDFETSLDGKKVCIICPEHGAFYQTYSAHVSLKQNCPKCAGIVAGSKRKGAKNVAHRQDVKKKKQMTCEDKYGAKTWAESDIGRQTLHDIIVSNEVSEKMQTTCQCRYGAKTWSESDEGKAKLHEIMSSDEMQEKIALGYFQKYGVEHYMKTEEGREKARQYLTEERRRKIRQSMYEKYGVYSFLESDVFQQSIALYQKKAWHTKHRNGTFSSSKPERTMESLLKDVFGAENVLSQYTCERYPFHCDFYIKSLDLFIELNGTWTHGGHFFDENNQVDIMILNEWKQRASEKGSRYYHVAIDTWTRRDLLKLQTAVDNNLNYLVFWDSNLEDFRDWLRSQSLL